MKLRATVLLLLAGASAAIASVDPALLARILQRQAALDDYAVDMRIRVSGLAASDDLEFPARSARKGAVTLQEFRNFIVLLHPRMRIVVDRADHTIHINAEVADAPMAPGMDPAVMLAQAGKLGFTIASEEDAEGVTLRFSSPTQPTYRLSFGKPDLRLQRMEMSADGGSSGRTVVTYEWHAVDIIGAARLDPDYYVVNHEGAWQPTAEFSGYRIVVSRER